MTATFRFAQRADLPRIVAIYNESIPAHQATADLAPVTVTQREAWFTSFDVTHPLWVVEQAGQIIGWLGLEPFYGRAAYAKAAEVAIYLTATAQHAHLGGQLLDFAIQEAAKRGLTALVAYIFGHNQPSLALFKSRGFVQWGYLPGVAELVGQRRDLVILGRQLG